MADVNKGLTLDEGFVSDVDVIFTDPEFKIDPQWGNGETVFLKVTASPYEGSGFDPFDLRLNAGKTDKWEITDFGETIVNSEKEDKNVNSNSKLGKFVKSMIEIPALAKELERRIENDEAPHGVRSAALYDNLVVHLDHRMEDYKMPLDDGSVREGETRVDIVTDFIKVYGEASEGKGAKKTGGGTKAGGGAKKSSGGGKVTKAERAKLDTLADDCETYEEFTTRAYAELAGLLEKDAVQALVDAPEDDNEVWKASCERAETDDDDEDEED